MNSIIETKQGPDMLNFAPYWMVKNMKGTSFDKKISSPIYIIWRIARFYILKDS